MGTAKRHTPPAPHMQRQLLGGGCVSLHWHSLDTPSNLDGFLGAANGISTCNATTMTIRDRRRGGGNPPGMRVTLQLCCLHSVHSVTELTGGMAGKPD